MKVLIIEDEPAASKRLRNLIMEILPDAEILDSLESIRESLDWFENNQEPDLIFLDIHLADGSSFEIFKHLKITAPIIFTTAFDQYAVQAFKVNSIDYLLKPIKRDALRAAIEKYKRLQPKEVVDYSELARRIKVEQASRRFLIRSGANLRVVSVTDAAYFFTENKISFLVDKQGKKHPIDLPLEKLEEELDPTVFFRINRQFIIGIHAIQEMIAYSKSRVKVLLNPPSDQETIVSTERSPHFKKWLSGE